MARGRPRRRKPSVLPWIAGALLVASGVSWYLAGRQEEPAPDVADVAPAEPTQDAAPAVMGPGVGTWRVDPPQASEDARSEALCAGCDVVVVTVCSLRRDHVGLYTGDPELTPHLDAFAKDAFRLEQAYAASNFTLAGLTAVLTGRYGASTGVTGWDKGLVSDVPTLPEVLGIYGYRTGAFTTDAPSGFRPDYGLDRGFQHMEIIPPPRDNPDGAHQRGEIGPGGASARPAAAWVAEQPTDVPMFVMFHTRTAHYPFVVEDDPDDETGVTQLLWASGITEGPAGAMPGTAGGTAQRGVVEIGGADPVQEGVRAAGDAGVAMWKQRYREAVQRTDVDVKVFAEALEQRGRLDQTVFVLLADHGESLGDHGELLHGDAYFDGVVHIPFLIRVPGQAGRPVDALASQVDLLPTVLDLVGAAAPAGIDGASLVPVLEGRSEVARHRTLVEGGVSWHDDDELRGAIISPPWALLRQDRGCGGSAPVAPGKPATCLFDLVADPGQDRDVAAQNPDVVDELMASWAAFAEARAPGERVELDPDFVEELQRTGYDFRPLDAD